MSPAPPDTFHTGICPQRSRQASAGLVGRSIYLTVVTAFLNPEVDGDVYMAMPGGVEAPAGGPWVCKLRKSVYGLKQAPRLWYEHIDNFLRSLGLLRSEYDPNVYISATGLIPLILLHYVDDILLFS